MARKRLHHQVPHWVRETPIYFITVCAEPRQINHFCNSRLGPAVLESIGHRHRIGVWFCDLAVLMPDHVHLLLSFPEPPPFSQVIGDWKRWLAVGHGVSWQENFFDHRLRKEESLMEKGDYVLLNPVRAGLVSNAQDWPYVWMPKE
jgi:putative transposase